MKQNDWLATLMYQPDMSLDELNSVGITVDNTELHDRDYYKNIDAVKQAFEVDGKFDEKKYNSFYDQALLLYNTYANKSITSDFIDTYKYDPMDWRYENADKSDVSSKIEFNKNPMGNSINTKALGIVSDSPFSMREIAQTNRVFNYEENRWEDWSPNDKGGLFKGFARPTLVMATYDSDGTHQDEYGRIVEHKKGDYKFDPVTGKPFYETLGNREIYSKDVLHISDTLTEDGSKINKFDFFDSDGLDKSVGGTVMKMTAALGPTFIGLAAPELGIIYGGLSALVALTQLVPTLGKAINGFITNDNSDTAVGKKLNQAEAWAARFGSSVSDHSREKTITVENAAGLIKDVALQLFQQRSIQYIPKLFKNNPDIYNNVNLAKQLSYAYMSGTSALESYSAFKQAGASDRVAGLGMLATTGAFYKLMSIDYFRDTFFKGSWFDDNNVKSPVWKVASDFMDAIKVDGKLAEDVAKNTVAGNQRTLKSLTKRFTDAINKVGKPWGPATFWERSFAEGVEETMEEAMQDSIKALFLGAEAVGIPMNKEKEKLDFGFSGRDMLTRYAMSFGGGFVGGAIFQGYNDLGERIDRAKRGISGATNNSDANLSEIVKLISDGKKEEILDTLEKWHKKERFGSNSLAATKLATVSSPDGNTTVSNPSGDDAVSQNDFIYKALVEQVNTIDEILTSENFKQNQIRKSLLKAANQETSEDDAKVVRLLELHSLVLKDLNRLGTKIVAVRKQISDREKAFPNGDTAESKKEAEEKRNNDQELKDLNAQLKELREQRDAILDGSRMAYYTSQYSLMLNAEPLKPFIGFSDFASFVRLRFGINEMDLTKAQRVIAEEEFEQYKNGGNWDFFRAIDVYNALSEELASALTEADKELGSAIVDPDLTNHTLGSDYIAAIKAKEQIVPRIEALTSKETLTEDETKELASLNKDLTDAEKTIKGAEENTPAAMLVNSYTTVEGESNLINELVSMVGNPELDAATISDLGQKVKAAYSDWVNNGVLKTSQPELQTFLLLVAQKARNIKDIKNTINDKLTAIIQEKYGSPDDFCAKEFDGDTSVDDLFNYDSDHVKPIHERLFSLVSQFYDDLKTSPEKALDTYNEIKTILGTRLTEEEINDFLYSYSSEDEILPWIGDKRIHEYLEEVQELQKQLKTSVLPKILSKFKTKITNTVTQNVLELLEDEQQRLASKTKLDQYTIDNETVRAGLVEALGILNAIKGLLLGASDGTNVRINKYKTSKKFAELSKESALLIANDIDEQINRISFLLELDAKNNGFKLKEHQEIAVNMRVQFLKTLTDAIHSEPFKDKFKGVDPAEIWQEMKPAGFDDINVDNYHEFENVIIQFESELYNRVKALGLSDKEIVENIFSIFTDDGKNSEIWKQISTNFKKDTDDISSYDLLFYIATILTTDANEFYSRLKDIVENKFEKAPLFGHEYIVRMGYSMLYNPDVFNMILDKVAESYPGSDEYIKSRKRIKNILFGLGGAGTGKTTSLALLFKELVKEDGVEFIYAASDETQVKNLCGSLKADSSEQRFTLKDFVKKIAGNQLNEDNIEKKDGNLVFKNTLKITEDPIFANTSNIRILICDEIETLNSLELQVLSEYASVHDVFILGLGDTKQPTAKVKGQSDSFEDIYAIKGPQLFASLRTLSVAKNDNYNLLDTRLDEINRQVSDRFEELNESSKRNNLTRESLEKQPIVLKYYTEGNRMVGDKIESDETMFKKNIDTAISINNTKVLIVTDKLSKYQSDKYTGNPDVVVRDVANALGGEFDYVFVDVEIDANNVYSELQKFYMLTQRSTLFTSVLDLTGKYAEMHITSKYSPASNALLQMPREAIENFKVWRLKGLEKVNYSGSSTKTRVEPEPIVEKKTPPASSSEEPPVVVETPAAEETPVPEEFPTVLETPVAEESSVAEESATPASPSEDALETTNSEAPSAASENTEAESTTRQRKKVTSINAPVYKPEPVEISSGKVDEDGNLPTSTEETPAEIELRTRKNYNTNEKEQSPVESNVATSNEDEDEDEDESDPTAYVETPFAKITPFSHNSRMTDYFNYIYSNNFTNIERDNPNSILSKIGVKKDYRKFIDKVSKYVCANKFNKLSDSLRIMWRNNVEGNPDALELTTYFNDKEPELWIKSFNGGNWLVLRLHNSTKAEPKSDFIEIPIMKTTISKTGFYTGEIKQASNLWFEKGERVSLEELEQQFPGLDIVSSAGILLDNNGEYEDSEKFIKINLGKCFIAVGNDYIGFRPEDVWKGQVSMGKKWTYSHSNILQLVGIQKILSNEEVLKYLACAAFVANTSNDESYTSVVYGWLKKLGIEPELKTVSEILYNITGNEEFRKLDELSLEKKQKFIKKAHIATKATSGIIISKILNEVLSHPQNYSNSSLWINIRRRFGTKNKPCRLKITTNDGSSYVLTVEGGDKDSKTENWKAPNKFVLSREDGSERIEFEYVGILGPKMGERMGAVLRGAGIDLSTSKAWFEHYDGVAYRKNTSNETIFDFLSPFLNNEPILNNIFNSIGEVFFANIRVDRKSDENSIWKVLPINGQKKRLTTDASKWHYIEYQLDESMIVSDPDRVTVDAVQTLINQIDFVQKVGKKVLSEDVLNVIYNKYRKIIDISDHISANELTQQMIDEVNEQIKLSSINKWIQLIEIDDFNDIVLGNFVENEDAVANAIYDKYGIEPDDLNFSGNVTDAVRIVTVKNGNSEFNAFVYYDSDGDCHVSMTEFGEDFVNIQSLLQAIKERKNYSADASILEDFLYKYITNNVSPIDANQVIDVLTRIPGSERIIDFMEKRLESEIDEC